MASGSASCSPASICFTIIAVATITGLLVPALAYLGVALDGSTVSRERDSLAAGLGDDLATYLKLSATSARSGRRQPDHRHA
jgi:hypothetical protein